MKELILTSKGSFAKFAFNFVKSKFEQIVLDTGCFRKMQIN